MCRFSTWTYGDTADELNPHTINNYECTVMTFRGTNPRDAYSTLNCLGLGVGSAGFRGLGFIAFRI